ncbi:ribose 1,5-bisphosphate phosphokinase PhnN [Agaricicola taiwanensis]|uniref:Ribose 1,5-bisphosphate phosphokinase PhnN n=1 Tax=Agaricicola taiwanensis TaxID=591372 RepID=A0A8J2YK89_9RHOB|nr:phosphonate metabolism protein/1,5-bisphosphokinase (PRPP-forming) PhnN [Agaricicola taiwanensis]GGE49312.1 ribose 1,5-bisphosphate phosphokinase PhnN [Agaricicola taiwanensis]
MSPEANHPGVFVAIVGPSGAGKDTLLSRAARELKDCRNVRFVRRVITRPSDGGTEDHDSLSQAAFLAAEAQGAFCLSWQAHGLHYALPAAVLQDLAQGHTVVANISRRALEPAAHRFGAIEVIEVTARPELLVGRLAARGRETEEEIRERIGRQVPLELPEATRDFISIDNSADLAGAVRQMVGHLRRSAGAARQAASASASSP